jgi:hypothetical protein
MLVLYLVDKFMDYYFGARTCPLYLLNGWVASTANTVNTANTANTANAANTAYA